MGEQIDALVTGVQFPEGKPHGVAVAKMLLFRCPFARVVFMASEEFKPHTEGLGQFLAIPVDPATVVVTVASALASVPTPPGTPFLGEIARALELR